MYATKWSLGSWPCGQWVSLAYGDVRRPGEVQPVNSAINANTVSHTCWVFTTSSVSPTHHTHTWSVSPPPLTFFLLLCAGDDPFDQAALHQSFPREPRLLPLPRILHPARCRLHAVGISQQAAIDHLAIRLKGREREKEKEREFRSIWKLNKPSFELSRRLCVCLENMVRSWSGCFSGTR